MVLKEATKIPLILESWVQKLFPHRPFRLEPLAGDASFRAYYRLFVEDRSFIVMSAGQDRDSCQPFVAIAQAFRKVGVLAPEIIEQDIDQGLLLLSDLGDEVYLQHLNRETADALYQNAFEALLALQSCEEIPGYSLPSYDEALYRRELNLFSEWYLSQHLGFSLTKWEEELLEALNIQLIQGALAQPQVCVHRDYHSRNLMVLPENKVGVLDFQDAVLGPITYDLLSVLRDCYISWPETQVRAWVHSFLAQKNRQSSLMVANQEEFYRWFDWIGLQRNLKCIGIFARLNARDHKPRYLADIPRVLEYVRTVSQRYPEFKEFQIFLQKRKILI